jgi:hypothetical protein
MRWLVTSIFLTVSVWAQDVRLELRCSTTAAGFHVGEIVPLDLEFTASQPKRYTVVMPLKIYGYREDDDVFHVTPAEGTRDPLAAHPPTGFSYDGPVPEARVLSEAKTIVQENLNEWISLDRPGTYRISVTSRRVRDNTSEKAITVQSNEIEIRVVAGGAEWERAVLESKPDDVTLRYLQSEDAAREMARRFRGDDTGVTDSQMRLGLIGTRQTAAAVDEMRRLLIDADFPVTQDFVSTLALLDSGSSFDSCMAALSSMAAQKTGHARAVSLDTVATFSRGAARSVAAEQLLKDFDQLPSDRQFGFLVDLPNSTDGVALARRIAQRYEDFPELMEMKAFESLQVTGKALTEWYWLDPAGARPAVIAEIERPRPRYGSKVLGLLPDKTLPESEAIIARNFLAAENDTIQANALSLLARYGGGSSLPLILPVIEQRIGTWVCKPQAAALAFVLKTSAATARPLIERALQPDCDDTILSDIAELYMAPELEQIALRRLDNSDLRIATEAARFLAFYGSAKAEQPMWQRYREWSHDWNGRTSELLRNPELGEILPTFTPRDLGCELANTLATARGWLADRMELERIQSLMLDPQCAEQIRIKAMEWSDVPTLVFVPGDPETFNLAQYAGLSAAQAKDKLAQFPEHATLLWTGAEDPVSPRQKALFEEISHFAAGHGVSVAQMAGQ